MEEKQLNEKESLELIAQMIRNTHQKLEKGKGLPFLIWGYTTVIVSLAVWYFFSTTGNPQWNFLWLGIPVIGFPIMLLVLRKQSNYPKTYIDKVIKYVWVVIGISAFIPSVASAFYPEFPILFTVALLISIGTAITGLIIKFSPISIAGFLGMLLSILSLIWIHKYESYLAFSALFLIVQVIPGHILNYKSRKSNV